ncbi:MAG TPA: helix-turn-helix domain-containing protein [Myxococcales bacterium]|nr:helix-turn-helix domain-containing protein [Myxococcales bacterium]
MRERRYSTELCPRFHAAVDLLGKRWTTLIVNVLLDGPLRFGELASTIDAISERVLSERLKELEQEGVLERRVLTCRPVHVEYRLTRKGEALGRVVRALGKWAEEWVEAPAPGAQRSAAARPASPRPAARHRA